MTANLPQAEVILVGADKAGTRKEQSHPPVLVVSVLAVVVQDLKLRNKLGGHVREVEIVSKDSKKEPEGITLVKCLLIIKGGR